MHTQNKKILVFGSGSISSFFEKSAKSAGYTCDVVSLRRTRQQLSMLDLDKYSLFIFSGYDHFSLYRNLAYIRLVIYSLKGKRCTGLFVYLNTQGVMLKPLARNMLPAYDGWIPDRYVLCIRIPSYMVRKSGLRYIEYFLPLVIGHNTNQDNYFRQLAVSPGIELPGKGFNHYFYLQIDSLFAEILQYLECKPLAENESIFIYSNYDTLVNMLRSNYGGSGEYLECRHLNAYNLPYPRLFTYLFCKFLKSIAAIIYYTFTQGSLPAIRSPDFSAISFIGPETVRFFSMDFLPPEKIYRVRMMRK